MARDRPRASPQAISRHWPAICLCLCSALVLGQTLSTTYSITDSPTTTMSTSAMDDGQEEEEEESTSLLAEASTERTSNAIPEAEQSTLDLLKKYNGKKLDKSSSSSHPADQLDKPYPYLKKAPVEKDDNKDNSIRQSKRSGSGDSLALNGTLKLAISQNSAAAKEPLQDTEATTIVTTTTTGSSDTLTTTTEEEASTTPALGTTFSDDEPTTIESTGHSSESTFVTEKSSIGETDTESTLTLLPSTTVTLLSSTTSTAATSLSASTVVSDSSASPTGIIITETQPSSTFRQDSSTTSIIEQDHSTITTPDDPLPPATTIAAESTVLVASTKVASRATTLLPVTVTTPTSTITATTTTTTTSTTTTTTTTAKPSTTIVSPKSTTITPENVSAVTTWTQDDTSETTTEFFSPTPSTEDVTLLVRIMLEGSWQDVCSKLPILRQSLTDLLNSSIDKAISARQIIFHQTQCSENLTPTSLLTDTQLTPVLVYVVDENGSFDGKLTKFLPKLYESSPIGFPLKIHSVTLVPEADSGNAIAVVIVSCVAFICLILLAGLLFIMRKRQGRFNYGERCRPVSLDAYSLDSVSAYNSVRRSKAMVRSSKRSYGNPAFEDSSVTPTHPLNFAGISTFCNDANAIGEEFAAIPQIHSKIEELPPGAEIKNRYANVIPLPETRVGLQRINNEPLSEYINASYVRGPKNATKYYIACQAPTETTVADFWRMIWEQQCKVIIMLTDLVENGVDKCTEYIPPLEVSDCHRLYGDYQVTLKRREAKEKYAISTLHLKNLENNTFREVAHIWYLWPSSGVPTDAAGLIAVLLEARALQRGAAGPILVHCSPGTGRTGTLIALDLCIRQYEVTRTVDVPRVVYTIRRDRAGAVQTREQYLFLYKGLHLYASKLAGGGIDST